MSCCLSLEYIRLFCFVAPASFFVSFSPFFSASFYVVSVSSYFLFLWRYRFFRVFFNHFLSLFPVF